MNAFNLVIVTNNMDFFKGEEIVHNCDNVYLCLTSEKCNQNSKCETPWHEPLVKRNSIFVRFIGGLV